MDTTSEGASRRAKVVCTLGPASDDEETIAALADAGMAAARFNASHGTPEQRAELVDKVRAVDRQRDDPVATILDLPGPEIRTASIVDTVTLSTDTIIEFYEGTDASSTRIGLTEPIESVQPGDRVLLDDGRIETTVTDVRDGSVRARVEAGGELGSRAGVNVPGVDLGLPAVTDSDREELDVAASKPVDFVAASFVRDARDVFEVEAALEQRGVDIPIIAKIERAGAVENLGAIVEAADAIMVARGDLGVECPLEDVPIIQKRIIRRCHRAGVPVITATEMLDSMIHEPRPTRAEASDVANAVLDGTDAVMLSGETAIGDHPVAVVETMGRIIADVEGSEEADEQREQRVPPAEKTRTDALARSARYLARDIDASAIVAATESGYTARKAAKYRPSIPVIASTISDRVSRQLAISWGIVPRQATEVDSADEIIQQSMATAIETGTVSSGDTVVVISGMMTELDALDTANMLKVHVASERLLAGRSVVSGFATGPLHSVGTGDLSDLPDGSILAVPAAFEGEFEGNLSRIGGIVDAHDEVTGYPAIVARELGIPMVGDAPVPGRIDDGRVVTLDAERGVLYTDPVEEQPEQHRE